MIQLKTTESLFGIALIFISISCILIAQEVETTEQKLEQMQKELIYLNQSNQNSSFQKVEQRISNHNLTGEFE